VFAQSASASSCLNRRRPSAVSWESGRTVIDMHASRRITQPLAAIAAAVAVAVLATACGGSSSGGTDQVAPAATGSNAPHTAASATVATRHGPDGTYLTDGNGRTLYMFSQDAGTSSSCSGGCAHEWPAYSSTSQPTSTGSARNALLGTTPGGTQVTYAGHPLYYYVDDESAGDRNGEGLSDFGGTWSMVAPNGQVIAAAHPAQAPSSDSSGGYSYNYG
jgi:predicted lipoprotein with Yx(FWY)xxD motif